MDSYFKNCQKYFIHNWIFVKNTFNIEYLLAQELKLDIFSKF